VGWSHDTRNRAIFPTRGVLQSLSAEVALPGLDLEYYKLSYQQRRYIPFSKQLTLLMRGEIAYGDGNGKNDSLPFFENFYAGGVRSVRGYRDNSLGEQSSEVPVGGNLKTIGAVELLFPPPFAADSKAVRMSAFFDAGYVFGGLRNFDIKQLRGSAGLSLSWFSPVGPLIFSYATPVNDREKDEIQNFQFSLGGTL
jgi:outer membrane protein insertion porin family